MTLQKQIGMATHDSSWADDQHKLSGPQLLGFIGKGLRKMLGVDRGGLFFIAKGSCSIRNKDDQFVSKTIRAGDFFGEGDLLKCVDYTFFGEIVAASSQVEVLYVSEEDFHKIPAYEHHAMRE